MPPPRTARRTPAPGSKTESCAYYQLSGSEAEASTVLRGRAGPEGSLSPEDLYCISTGPRYAGPTDFVDVVKRKKEATLYQYLTAICRSQQNNLPVPLILLATLQNELIHGKSVGDCKTQTRRAPTLRIPRALWNIGRGARCSMQRRNALSNVLIVCKNTLLQNQHPVEMVRARS